MLRFCFRKIDKVKEDFNDKSQLNYDFDFSIVIVTYNSKSHILQCIESIKKQIIGVTLEIIIVDNNSNDETYTLLQTIPLINTKIIRNNENLGFSSACNIGALVSKGRVLYFCNPDTVIIDNIFVIAKKHFQNKSIGCFSPKILNIDGSEAPFAFKFPHPPFSIIKAFFKNLIGKSNAKILQINYSTYADIIYCDWVMGACMFIPHKVFSQIGGFDEDFFLYFEDVDICKKIKQEGYKIIADRNCTIIHEKYGSSRNLSKSMVMNIRLRSEFQYYKKHYGVKGFIISKLFDRKGYLFRA